MGHGALVCATNLRVRLIQLRTTLASGLFEGES